MLSRHLRSIGLACLGLASVFSCSVFPDEATLPPQPVAGSGGDSMPAQAGAGGDTVDMMSVGGDGAGAPTTAAAGEGGAPSMGGASAAAGEGGATAGAGAGAGGDTTAPCVNLEQQAVVVTADTWIDSAKTGAGHGNDAMLSVVAGTAERRTLLGFTLPAVPAGKVLNRASLVLHLESDADVKLTARRLGLHKLDQPVSESRATWTNYANGANGRWAMLGGDFGPEVSSVMLRAGTSSGGVTFKVTELIRTLIGPAPIPLALIVLEKSSPPAEPAELAFTSSEGDASGIPALILDYCDQ